MNAMRKFTMTGLLAAATLAASVAVAAAAAPPPGVGPGPGDGCGCGGGGAPASRDGWHGRRHGMWDGWHHRGPGMWLHALDLNGSQRQTVHAILHGASADLRDLHEQMRSNMMKLAQSAPDAADHAALVAQVSRVDAALFGQMIVKREDVRAKIYAVLTPAQKQRLAAMRAKMAAHGPHGHGCRPARGDAPPRG